MLRYCRKCVMPDSKPDIFFDEEGVCSACRNYENRKIINWQDREKELKVILQRYKSESNARWDCIVPVSGGKDSTYQVIKMINLGMNPLCITSTTCDESELGRQNINNLRSLGVDHIQFSPNPKTRAKLNRIGLEQVGDISWPEHVGIFTIPVRAAVDFKVPLIIWGENSQNEYGGPASSVNNKILNRRWLEEFGGLLGMRVSDIPIMANIDKKDLILYNYPTDDELKEIKVTGLFLGYYLPWDGYSNSLLAQSYGFKTYEKIVEGSMVNYENLDNYQTGIHDYFKFLKFGFGRATDIACLHIRRGRISRDEGLAIVRNYDGKFPWTYLGKDIRKILKRLEINLDEFIEICDTFTNKNLFKKDESGKLLKDQHGNLEKINYDNK